MSDFLDRLAARAIGNEPMLVPRLPSWFESLQRADLMPRPEDLESRPPHGTGDPDVSAANSSAWNDAGLMPASLRQVSVPASPIDVKRTAATPMPQSAAVSVSTSRTMDVRSAASPNGPRPPDPSTPTAVQPRQTRGLTDRHSDAMPAPHSTGALPPLDAPVMPVFRAPDGSISPSRAADPRRSAGLSVDLHGSVGEPVVHVSIGRLEVRAAATTAPPRRRESPQSNSLDDYLRQRSGRSTP
ncbi:MAG: hypothetical protein ABI870_06210 [Rhodanobacter sp.]